MPIIFRPDSSVRSRPLSIKSRLSAHDNKAEIRAESAIADISAVRLAPTTFPKQTSVHLIAGRHSVLPKVGKIVRWLCRWPIEGARETDSAAILPFLPGPAFAWCHPEGAGVPAREGSDRTISKHFGNVGDPGAWVREVLLGQLHSRLSEQFAELCPFGIEHALQGSHGEA